MFFIVSRKYQVRYRDTPIPFPVIAFVLWSQWIQSRWRNMAFGKSVIAS